MSLVIPMDNIKSTDHLKKAIAYIMQEHKAKGLVYSNSGITPEDIFNTFLLTKKTNPRKGEREGYHYKFSFSKDEKISYEDALSFVKEWANEYLGDDYVVATHSDRDLTHMHLVFNSTSRIGKKYRYEKSDWKTIIKPLTNRLCDKYHTGYLKEKDKEKDYAKPTKWKNKVQTDIDLCIQQSADYKDFKEIIQQKYGYVLREGVSRDYGLYWSLTPPDKAKAIRTYQLDSGYMPEEIEEKLNRKKELATEKAVSDSLAPPDKAKAIRTYQLNSGYMPEEIEENLNGEKELATEKAVSDSIAPPVKSTKSDKEQTEYYRIMYCRVEFILTEKKTSYIPYKDLTKYQQYFVKKMLNARRLYSRTNTTLYQHEQSVRSMKELMRDAGIVCHMNIKTENELKDRISHEQKGENEELLHKLKRVLRKSPDIENVQKKEEVQGKERIENDKRTKQ